MNTNRLHLFYQKKKKSKVEKLFIFIFTEAYCGMTGYFLWVIYAESVSIYYQLLSTKHFQIQMQSQEENTSQHIE